MASEAIKKGLSYPFPCLLLSPDLTPKMDSETLPGKQMEIVGVVGMR